MISRFRGLAPRTRVRGGALAVLAVAVLAAAAVTVATVPGHHTSTAPSRSVARLADTPQVLTFVATGSGQTPAQCLDSNSDGQVYIDPCNGNLDQSWIFNADGSNGSGQFGTIVNQATGWCLGSDSSIGQAAVWTGGCTGIQPQWTIIGNASWNDLVQIYNEGNALCLNIQGPGAPGDPDSVNAIGCNISSTIIWTMPDAGYGT